MFGEQKYRYTSEGKDSLGHAIVQLLAFFYTYHLEYPKQLCNTSFSNNLYWEIIMCHKHLEFSTAIMKLLKSTWFLPTLCKFRTLAVTVQVNFVVEIDLTATPLYTVE